MGKLGERYGTIFHKDEMTRHSLTFKVDARGKMTSCEFAPKTISPEFDADICKLGGDEYIGKVIHERIATDRVDDVRRNVLSNLQRLFPDVRFPAQLDIFACEVVEPERPAQQT